VFFSEDVIPAVIDAAKLALCCSDGGDSLLALEALVFFRLFGCELPHDFLDILLLQLSLGLLLLALLLLLVDGLDLLHFVNSHCLHFLFLLLLRLGLLVADQLLDIFCEFVRTGVSSLAVLGLSVLLLELLLFLLLGLKDVLLELDTLQFCVLLSDLVVGEFAPHLDELLVATGLVAEPQLLCHLVDHLPLKGCHVVYRDFPQDLAEDLPVVLLHSCLLLYAPLLERLLIFLFLLLFLLLLLVRLSLTALLRLLLCLFVECLYLVAGSQSEPDGGISSKLFSACYMPIFLNPVHEALHVLVSRCALSITDED
jgi:hypothetical protein